MQDVSTLRSPGCEAVMTMHRFALLARLLAACLGTFFVCSPAVQAQQEGVLEAGSPLRRLPPGLILVLDPPAPPYQPLEDDPHEFRPGAELEVQGRLQVLGQLREMQQNARKLARDPNLIHKLRGKFRPEEVEELRRRLESGQNLNASPQMQDLFRKLTAGRSGQGISEEQLNALRKLVEPPRLPPPTEGPPSPAPTETSTPPAPSTESSPAPAGEPEPPTPWSRLHERAAEWMRDNMREAGDDLAGAVEKWKGPGQGQAVRDLFTGKEGEGGLRSRLAERAYNLAGQLPRLSVPKMQNPLGPFRSLWTNADLPRMDGIAPAAPRGKPSSSLLEDWTFAILFGLLGVLLLVLLGRQAQLRQTASAADAGKTLGPWPVAPEEVSTRQQVVAAFDYLALSSLGLQARAWHHLEVAAQLAHQGSDLARQQAAERLAHVYEQARYAPPAEPLAPEALADARRSLCLLAGVNPP